MGTGTHMSQILDIHRFLETIALSSNSFPSKTFQSLKIYWWSHTKTFDFEVYQNYFLEATKNLTKTLVGFLSKDLTNEGLQQQKSCVEVFAVDGRHVPMPLWFPVFVEPIK